MGVTAKFRVTNKSLITSALSYGEPKPADSSYVTLLPVAGTGNEEWSKWTPDGKIKMRINNPAAFDQFEVGKDYVVDFTPVE